MKARDRLTDNPFFVLGLPPDASGVEIERTAHKLLGMLELGLADAATYQTPLGPQPRTPERVRTAAAVLREPRRRLVAELWAAGGADLVAAAPAAEPAAPAPAWPDALAQAGWTRVREEERG